MGKRRRNVLRGYRDRMRVAPTPGERRMFAALCAFFGVSEPVNGHPFIFQHVIESCGRGYIADFYIPDLKLVIEVDGSVHDSAVAKFRDAKRTEALEKKGLRVVRVSNHDTESSIFLERFLENAVDVARNRVRQMAELARGRKKKGRGKARPVAKVVKIGKNAFSFKPAKRFAEKTRVVGGA